MKSVRLFRIVEYVERRRCCSLAELMEEFKVSVATIHRDVAQLVKGGRLRKVHGGVAVHDAAPDASEPARQAAGQHADGSAPRRDHYAVRLEANREAKRRIAEMAVESVRDGDIIFLDSSTTVYHLALALRGSRRAHLTLVTNSVSVMREFPLFAPGHVLIGLGGNYDIQLNALLGQSTLRELERLSFDKAFVSAVGVDDSACYSRHENHAAFLAAVLERSREALLLVDSGKLGKAGLFPIAPRERFNAILTEDGR